MDLKSFAELPAIQEPQPTIIPRTSSREWFKNLSASIKVHAPRQGRELIAGGDILWKPVDAQAAKLLSRGNFREQHNTETKMKTVTPPKTEYDQNRDDQLTSGLAHKLVAKAADAEKNIVKFSDEVVMARQKLDQATDMFRKDVLTFIDELPAALEKVRQWRMTIEREKDLSIRALADLRKFFLEESHEREMGRLIDFVRTCERLSVLAKDGTLEKVADVMLKLA